MSFSRFIEFITSSIPPILLRASVENKEWPQVANHGYSIMSRGHYTTPTVYPQSKCPYCEGYVRQPLIPASVNGISPLISLRSPQLLLWEKIIATGSAINHHCLLLPSRFCLGDQPDHGRAFEQLPAMRSQRKHGTGLGIVRPPSCEWV